jgi:hypothetical protein
LDGSAIYEDLENTGDSRAAFHPVAAIDVTKTGSAYDFSCEANRAIPISESAIAGGLHMAMAIETSTEACRAHGRLLESVRSA